MTATSQERSAHEAAQLVEALEDCAQRMTDQRALLARHIEFKYAAFTAQDIAREVPGVGRATIYRTLKLLVDAGALCKMQLPDGSPRYKRDNATHHHHHLVCTVCRQVQEFRHPAVERMLRTMCDQVSGTFVGHRLEIFIVCSNCAQTG